MEAIIQSTTKPENPKKGIKYNDAWHTVVGKAANYVDTLKLGDIVEVREGESGVVTFIQKKSDAADTLETDLKNRQLANDQSDMFRTLEDINEKVQAIIAQNSVNNALLYEIAKKLQIDINQFKPASEI